MNSYRLGPEQVAAINNQEQAGLNSDQARQVGSVVTGELVSDQEWDAVAANVRPLDSYPGEEIGEAERKTHYYETLQEASTIDALQYLVNYEPPHATNDKDRARAKKELEAYIDDTRADKFHTKRFQKAEEVLQDMTNAVRDSDFQPLTPFTAAYNPQMHANIVSEMAARTLRDQYTNRAREYERALRQHELRPYRHPEPARTGVVLKNRLLNTILTITGNRVPIELEENTLHPHRDSKTK